MIREYNEHDEEVEVKYKKLHDGSFRWVIEAYNEGGYNSTQVDLLDVIAWVRENRPELLSADWDESGREPKG